MKVDTHQVLGVVAFPAIQFKLVKLSRANGSISLSYYKVIVEEGCKDLRRKGPIRMSRMVELEREELEAEN